MRSLFFFIFLFLYNSSYAQSITNDESYLDDSFWKFKITLANTVIKKDKEKLKDLLYNKILECWDAFDCAGSEGCNKEKFIDIFFDENENKNWEILKNIVKIGFSRKIDTTNYKHINEKRDSIIFVGPSFNKELSNENSKIIVLAENLNVRFKPSLNSKIITTISYGAYECELNQNGAIVEYFGNKISWIKVKLSNGTEGYIAKKFTSAFLDRTVKVAKINNEWKLIVYYCNLEI